MTSRKSRRLLREKKRQQRIRVIIGLFIIGLMVLSSIAFIMVFYSTPSQNGIPGLQLRDGILYLSVNDKQVPFYSYPNQFITVSKNISDIIKSAPSIIILFDPTDHTNLEFIEQFRWDFANYVSIPQGAAITKESELYPYPISSCDQASKDNVMIYLVNGTPSINLSNYCIIISGQQTDFLFVRDQLLYDYFGVVG